jgi:hypothetical protein
MLWLSLDITYNGNERSDVLDRFEEDKSLRDLNEIYRPLLDIVTKVIDGLMRLDLHIPIYKIARMVTQHKFDAGRHHELRAYITRYLEETNRYRRVYWVYIKLCQQKFDHAMQQDGSYGVTAKQYKSLRNELPDALLRGSATYWINSYDMYLAEIRKYAEKTAAEPRTGEAMYWGIFNEVKYLIDSIYAKQRKLLVESEEFKRSLEVVCATPHKRWKKYELEVWDTEGSRG